MLNACTCIQNLQCTECRWNLSKFNPLEEHNNLITCLYIMNKLFFFYHIFCIKPLQKVLRHVCSHISMHYITQIRDEQAFVTSVMLSYCRLLHINIRIKTSMSRIFLSGITLRINRQYSVFSVFYDHWVRNITRTRKVLYFFCVTKLVCYLFKKFINISYFISYQPSRKCNLTPALGKDKAVQSNGYAHHLHLEHNKSGIRYH